MTSTTVTEPIALARRARHRKPNRRRGAITRAAGVALLAAAAVWGTTAASASHSSPAFYGLTAAQAATVHPSCPTPGGGRIAYGEAAEVAAHTYYCAAGGQLAGSPAWDHVRHMCHVTRSCTYVPADVRRDLGIGGEQVAVMSVGDTSRVYVLTGKGVRVYES